MKTVKLSKLSFRSSFDGERRETLRKHKNS